MLNLPVRRSTYRIFLWTYLQSVLYYETLFYEDSQTIKKTQPVSFYPDEITITESELIGLTVDQAKRLKFEKDLRYLQY